MAETSRDGDRVICTLGALTVEVTFDPSGTEASYITRLDGVLHGEYRRHILPNVTEQGRYKHGRKIGKWREWDPDSGHIREGSYVSGARNGPWKVFSDPDQDQDSPLFEVDFQGGQRMRAQKNIRSYHGLMFALDSALIVSMYYGNTHSRSDIEYGSILGFTLLPPLLHGVMQQEHLKSAAGLLLVRPAFVATVFQLVTIYKVLAGIKCDRTKIDGEGNETCVDLGYDFDGDYDVHSILATSMLLVALGDVYAAFTTAEVSVYDAFPNAHLVPLPVSDGAGLGVAGSF